MQFVFEKLVLSTFRKESEFLNSCIQSPDALVNFFITENISKHLTSISTKKKSVEDMAFTYSVVNLFSFGFRSHQQAVAAFSTLKISSF